MTKSLVVGIDAGATSTRVSVHSLDGTRVGYARAGAGNPSAHGMAKAVAAIGSALGQALGGLPGSSVVASMAGVAGHVKDMQPELTAVWASYGIPQGPRLTGDVPIAYAAGSPEPDGSLLLSGTGATAAGIVGFTADRIADGLGWLLGDQGSGFWIGHAATKAVIEALDRDAPVEFPVPGAAPSLVALVAEHFLGAERPATPRAAADRIVRLAQADHMRLAALSSAVSQAAGSGDAMALAVVREAADRLVASLRRVHVAGRPVVFAGSVLTSAGPVRQAVLDLLAGERVSTALDGAGAAAWLAARDLLPAGERERLHAAFTTPPVSPQEAAAALSM
ncbi:ATPase [Nonomuraea sp. NN258]|uniref:N-acetylglucosamine kinase n=1 Tax=Nonomuraea antri TaxID=2730852 RepID=UPI00156804C9|nr:BadF/BadG/BcrA/BcrD ATPase family protein [Nonomuraea antri]NRQ40030.1 ATPase [Nonomuraea antri]